MDVDLSGLAKVRPQLRALADEMVAVRRDLHAHPERGFEETRTAEKVVAWLKECPGFRVRTGVAKTGVIADLDGGRTDGKTVLLRADMDALRANEENPHLEYRSTNPCVMHACGHDGHVAILLGVARVLSQCRARMNGCVRLIFQPAEEGPGGAMPMITEGALRDPRPDAAFALHLWSRLPIGYAGLRAGPMMAYTDEIEIRLHGKGGHGAYPHEGIDTVLAAAQLIVALQSIVSRSVDPTDRAVVSIGSIQGGTVMNALAEHVTLAGTQRTFEPATRDLCTQRVHDIAAGIDRAFGTQTEVCYSARYPALVNDARMAQIACEAIEGVLGAGHVQTDLVSMGGEDMGDFLQEIPGCFFFLGAGNDAKRCSAPHHSPHFNFDEDALGIGAEILLRLTEHFVGPLA
jgi:amidohydrolase